VRFKTAAEPYRVGLCHCLTCRKHSGSVFNLFAIFPADQLAISGSTAVFESSATYHRHFCPVCGSPVFGRDVDTDEIELHVGAFDEPNQVRPTYELWHGRRERWLPDFGGMVKYPANREETGREESQAGN